MHLLTEGKESFLEFLRNLGPQILITAAAIILQATLGNATTGSFEWYKQLVVIVFLWLTWVFALIANINNFIEKFTSSVEEFKKYEDTRGQGTWKRMKLLWNARKSFFIEALVVIGIVVASLLTVMVTSVISSAGAINNLHIVIK